MEIIFLSIAWLVAAGHCLMRRDIDWSTRVIYLAVLLVTGPAGPVIYCVLLFLRRRPAGEHVDVKHDRPCPGNPGTF